MRVFFDVDYTILGQDGTIRPGTEELFSRLVGEGHEIYVWSGFGDRSHDLQSHAIDRFVRGYFTKPVSGYYLGHEHWGLPFAPDFVVDDHPGPVAYLGGIVVSAYVDRHTEEDAVMSGVYVAVTEADRLRRHDSRMPGAEL